MKIAVRTGNGQVCRHFGHTPEFPVCEVKGGKSAKTETLPCGSNRGH